MGFIQRQRLLAAANQMRADPQQVQRPAKFDKGKQPRKLAQRAPADNHQKNIKRVARGNAEAQSGAAAQPIARGVAHQQEEIRARA